jgi:hypothetical protein
MNQPSKLMLSPQELQLVNNTDWILTKRVIIDKVCALFGEQVIAAQQHVKNTAHCLPEEVTVRTPKISKGENYLQLPWVMLDYPRCFEKENIFAIRSFFWWGNFFSVTLHLSGQYKKLFQCKIAERADELRLQNYYLCINENQWQHHLQPDNYIPCCQLSNNEIEQQIINSEFIKLTTTCSLQQWADMICWLEKSFVDMLKLVIN